MKIAIFRKDLGNYSETFVRRNVDCINAGNTVVICNRLADDYTWKPTQPTLYLGDYPRPIRPYIAYAFLLRHHVKGAVCEFLDYATEWVPLFKRLNIPFIALGHGYDIGRNLKKIPDYERALSTLKSARKIIVPCNYGKETLLKKTKLDPGLIESIPVGIDLAAFKDKKLNREGNRFLFVGRFVEKKSPIYLLMAFYHATKNAPNIILDCIGNGPLLPAAKHLALSLGIADKVNFLGIKSPEKVREAMKNARATVQHSVTAENGDMETMPLSIQESLASGTPAIVTNHAGLPEIVTDGITGYIVNEGDHTGMGEKITSMARIAPDDYRKLQENCIAESHRFDSNTRTQRIEQLLGI
jgi:colanic acid/amylovoran biosynthesis glycosyltransferase